MNQNQIQQLVDLLNDTNESGRGILYSSDYSHEDFAENVDRLIEIFPEHERPIREFAKHYQL